MIELTVLHLIGAIIILTVSAIPAYLSLKLKDGSLRRLTALFAIFLVVHGFYHVAMTLGFGFIGAKVLQPLSVVILIVFGLAYLKKRRQQQGAMQKGVRSTHG